MKVLTLIFLFSTFVSLYASQNSDLITSLPLFSGDLGTQYSGYITIKPSTGKSLHYWFVESQGNPQKDPVVLWLNGGPGCSSMDGFWYEHGPLHWGEGKGNITVVNNPWAWTRVASVVYLESPAGVGFSYSNDSSDYNTGDVQAAKDNYAFLKLFFQKYPQFASNPFWISGESYAGIYVPSLAQLVAEGIESGDNNINFQGVLVGNGVTDRTYDNTLNAFVPFVAGHGLISPETYEKIQKYCTNPSSFECQAALNKVEKNFEDIDVYDIYTDCFHQRNEREGLKKNLLKQYFPSHSLLSTQGRKGTNKKLIHLSEEDEFRKPKKLGVNPPCTDATKGDQYLNLPQVKQAIHVRQDLKWALCTDQINYNSNFTSMMPIYTELLSKGYKVLIYSGEADGAVPYTGSALWTSKLGLTRTSLWREWFIDVDDGQQVAGYATEYKEGLVFATIKGAGHMVPQFKPAEGFYLFQRFIQGQPL